MVFLVRFTEHRFVINTDPAVVAFLGKPGGDKGAVKQIPQLNIFLGNRNPKCRHKAHCAALLGNKRRNIVVKFFNLFRIIGYHQAKIILTEVTGNTAVFLADFAQCCADLRHKQITAIVPVPFVKQLKVFDIYRNNAPKLKRVFQNF